MIAAALLLWCGQAQATHAMGGELSYVCLGNHQYLVTLNFYRDCNGVAAPSNCNNGLEFRVRSNSCNANFAQCFNINPTVEVITPICASETDRCVSASGTYGVERYTYTKIVDLSAYGNCGSDWEIYWSLCCRNNAITSLQNPGNQNLYLNAKLNNTAGICNSSAAFTNSPTAFFCLGEPISYNPGAVDPDGDSLAYALIPARTYPGTPIPYQPGFSASQPIKNNGGADAVVLDPQTGTMTVTPSILQVAVVTYEVTEYRNGVVVGVTTRDVQFVVRPCTGNLSPTATGINGTAVYTMEFCAGTPITFTVNSNDANIGQSVTMGWNSGIPTGNFAVSGGTHPTGTFTWTPTAANIGNNTFTVNVTDDGCPLTGSNDYGYSINVTPPVTNANAGLDQSVCSTSATLAGVLPYAGVQGTWTVVSGSGTFADLHSPTTTVSGLTQGTNVFQWSVDYLTCGITTDQVTVVRYNPAQAAAAAGADQSFCLPANSASLAGNPAVSPAVGTWTLVSGTGSITSLNSPTTTVTGLGVGQNHFRWTINNGPCGTPTQDEVVISIFNNAQAAANAGPDIVICSPSSSVTMNANTVTAPATGSWTLVSGSGTITSPTTRNTTITGLPVGVHVFQWAISNGPCTPGLTTDNVTVTVYSASSPNANAGVDQAICTPGNATLSGSIPTFPATGAWSVVSGTATITSPNSPTSTLTGLGIGANVLQWTVNNGPCANGITSDQVVITAYDNTVSGSNAGPDQSLCTPNTTATMAANAPASPAQGTWSLVSGTGNIADIHSSTTTISGLGIGENIFRWDVSNGPCPVNPPNDLVSIFIYDATAPAAAAGADQVLCTPVAFATLAANAPTAPGTGQWTVVAGTGNFANVNLPGTAVSGLSLGANTFRWKLTNGPCANPITQDDVSIVLYSSGNPVANAGADQELCTPANSTTLAGSSTIPPAAGTWTLVSGAGTIVSPANPSTQVTGLAVGDNVFRWTVNNGPCFDPITFDEVRIRVFNAANLAANAGPDQVLCSDANFTAMIGSGLIFPATGIWTLVTGSGSITSPSSPTTAITGLGVGTNTFRWTVSNGPCPAGTTDDLVSIFVYSSTHPAITAGPDQSICIPTSPNSVTVFGTTPVSPATGQWTLISGSGTIASPNSPSTILSNMGIGVNVFQWTVQNGPCTFPGNSAQVTIQVFSAAVLPANAGPNQNLCTPITSTVLAGSGLVVPATGNWIVVSGTGVFADPGDPLTAVSGLSLGSNVFRWSVNNGPCAPPTSDLVNISLFNGSAQQAMAGPDQELCNSAASTTLAANAAVSPATGVWSVLQGTATFADPTDPTTIANGFSLGVNILVWSLDNGGCGTSTDQVKVTVFDDANAIADAGSDQQLCTPITATTLVGSSLLAPATGTWTLVSGTGTIVSPTTSTTQVNGLGVGNNVFRWTVYNGPCASGTTFDEVTISVFNGSALAANAGPDQEICTPTSSVVMAGIAASVPAIGTWTLISGGGVFVDLHSASTTVSGLLVGNNVFEWSVDNGTCGTTTDQVTIHVFDANNPSADAGPDLELCTPTDFATMAGSALTIPATGTWTLVSGTGIIADPGSPTTSITGMAVGVNTFRWTVSNGPCANALTTSDVNITVFDQSVSGSDAGPDQELCTPLTTAVMAASATGFPAIGTWTLESGSGTITAINDPHTTITGLAVGENVFRWSVTNGPCPVNPPTDVVSIFVFDENDPVANAGPDQQLCSPTSSTTLAGSSYTFPANGTWSVVSGTGIFANVNDPVSGVSGLSIGVNVFAWTVTNGPCSTPTSADQVSIFVFNDANADADAGADQSLCTPMVSATLAGNTPIFPAIGTWTLVQGTGVITGVNNPLTTVTGLSVGENIFQWTVDNGPCANGITSDQVSIFIFDANNPNATAGDDQELCLPTTSSILAGSAVTFPGVGTWTLVSGSGSFSDLHDPNSGVTGLAIGANTFMWTVVNGLCSTTSDEVVIYLFDDAMPIAAAGPDQELCSPASSTLMVGSSITYPAQGQWTLFSGSATITDPSSPTTAVSDLAVGEHVFVWSVNNGPCPNANTSDTMVVRVFDTSDPVADAGADQELCDPGTSASLLGSTVTFPATGTWTVIQGSGAFADEHATSTTVTGLAIGVNILRWSVSNGPCPTGDSFDEVSITLFDQGNPLADAGADQSLCNPTTSTVMAGSAIIFPAQGTWMLVTGTGTLADPNSPTTAVSGLSIGENVFQWSVVNGPCNDPSTSDLVSIYVYDDAVPVANAGADQQVCTPVTSANLSGSPITYPATGEWTLTSGQGTITDPSDPLSTVTGLGVGQSFFTWTVDNGPCGAGITSDVVRITLFNVGAPPAAAGPDQSFCAPVSTANLAGNTPTVPAIGTWIVEQGTGSFTDLHDPNTAVTGLSIGENILSWTIDNGVCGITHDSMSVFIFDPGDPVADAGLDQEYCTPQDSTYLTGNVPTFPAQGTWSVIDGVGLFADANDPATKVVGLTIGANTFVWTMDNGPCADAISTDTVTVILYSDSTSAAYAGEDFELCLPITDTQLAAATPQLPATGTWSVLSGSATIVDPTDPQTQITDLALGVTTFLWTLDNGPCPDNGLMTDTVSISVFDPFGPTANAGPDILNCAPEDSVVMAANTPLFPAEGTWALVSGTGIIADVNDPASAVTGLSIGINTFTWSIYNGNCGFGPPTVDTVRVYIYDNTAPSAVAGEDQAFCTPIDTVPITANPATFPGIGTWSLFSGTAEITTINEEETTVTELGVGDNVFVWTIYNGPCSTTTDTVHIVVFDDQLPAADAGPDQEWCAPTTTIVLAANNAPFPSSGSWTVAEGAGVFVDNTDPNTQVSGFGLGTNVYVWSISNGPCGITRDSVTVLLFDDLQAAADAGADQEFCQPQDSTLLVGNAPTFPAEGTWTILAGGGAITDPNDPASPVTGMTLGLNTFVWTIDNGPCPGAVTSDTMSVILYDDTIAPAFAGDDFETCLPMTSVQLFADVPVFPASGTWSILSGPGVLEDPSDAHTMVNDLALGVTTFLWTLDNGPCAVNGLMTDTLTVSVFDPFGPTALAGPDMSFCSPEDSAMMAGNMPLSPATGTWTLISGSGVFDDQHDPTTWVTELAVGDNVFIWSIYNGNCGFGPPTVDTVHVFLFDGAAPDADAGLDQAYCTPIDSVEMAANAATFPGSGLWALQSGSGSIVALDDPISVVTDLAVGDNIFTWTIFNGPCGTTVDTMHIVVFDGDLVQPDAGADQEWCSPTDTVVLAADPAIFPSTGMWTVLDGSGVFVDGSDPGTAVTGFGIGRNSYVWTISNGPCGSLSDTVVVTLFDGLLVDAFAGPDQDLCGPVVNVQLAATPVDLPAVGTWSIVSGSGVLSDPGAANATLDGTTPGQTILVWSVDNGPCSNLAITDTVVMVIFDGVQQPVADAGPDQQLCEPGLFDADMFANEAIFPAIGSWSFVSGTGDISDAFDRNTTITGVGFGTSTFAWTIDNGVCGSTTDEVSITIFDSNVLSAAAGLDQQLCHDTTTTRMAAVPVTSTANGHWELISGQGSFIDPIEADAEVSGLALGINAFQWIVENGVCGTTSDTMFITLRDCSILVVPDAFSPNGDGVNDTYVIRGLEYYPNNSFQVFNRWGSKVYERGPYRSTWDGTSEGGLDRGAGLPESTYYFILDPGNDKEIITGYIYLRR